LVCHSDSPVAPAALHTAPGCSHHAALESLQFNSSTNWSVPLEIPISLAEVDYHLFVHAVSFKASWRNRLADLPPEEVVARTVDLVRDMPVVREDTRSLLGADEEAEEAKEVVADSNATEAPHVSSKLEVRVLFDTGPHTWAELRAPPLNSLLLNTNWSFFKPEIYPSCFWSVEDDYIPVKGNRSEINVTVEVYPITTMAWALQKQMTKQWEQQSEVGLSTGKDTFMLKRMILTTNPITLVFSVVFLMSHTFFGFCQLKNEVQFWRNVDSMHGLSARSMGIGLVTRLIVALYLWDSEAKTSKMILFQTTIGVAMDCWKLSKAISCQISSKFPFVRFHEKNSYQDETSQYDKEAVRYMSYAMYPCAIGYALYSLLYLKHKSWYSYLISSLAGFVYTFGFVMMTPQLYINYRLKSVEHIPFRAMTYRAMSTFVDDVAAFLIDMPLMHRLSCLRDDIVFMILIYQRWIYRVDKSRVMGVTDQPATEEPAAVAALEALEPELVCGDGKPAQNGSQGEILSGEQPGDQDSSIHQRRPHAAGE